MKQPFDSMPQPGPQEQFLATDADIALYGGAAYGGKTWALLLESMRGIYHDEYHGMLLRRRISDAKKSGAIVDESKKMFKNVGGSFNKADLKWTFPHSSNVDITFYGVKDEEDYENFQGSQPDFVGMDELTQFLEKQFWYIFGRLRSMSGEMNAYLRATCNPEPGWVADLISWWIGEDGYPIRERSGVIRWLVRSGDEKIWFDTKDEALSFCDEIVVFDKKDDEVKRLPTSFTFIAANIEDNQIGMQKNPEYISKLYSLPEIERKRLLYGNWKVSKLGRLFRAEDFKVFAIKPADIDKTIVTVDTAQETKTANDYTVMQVWVRSEGKIYLLYQLRGKFEFPEQVRLLASIVIRFKPNNVNVEKKANGSALIQSVKREAGVNCPVVPIERNKDKYTRGFECQEWVKGGYVYLNPAEDYYADFIAEATGFAPENKEKVALHDDQVDCMMDAIDDLLINYEPENDDEIDYSDFISNPLAVRHVS